MHKHISTFPQPYQYTGCLLSEASLVVLASRSILWLCSRVSLSTRNRKFIGSTPIDSTRICSSAPPVSLTEKKSFSCIQRAWNSPSHFYQQKRGFSDIHILRGQVEKLACVHISDKTLLLLLAKADSAISQQRQCQNVGWNIMNESKLILIPTIS